MPGLTGVENMEGFNSTKTEMGWSTTETAVSKFAGWHRLRLPHFRVNMIRPRAPFVQGIMLGLALTGWIISMPLFVVLIHSAWPLQGPKP